MPFKRVDRLWVLFKPSEYLTLFAGFGVFKCLKMLNFSSLTMCHSIPKEIVFDNPLPSS